MGLIYADIELINEYDKLLALDGLKKEADVRKMKCKALVDTGSIMMAINEEVQQQLGLRVITKQFANLANGEKTELNIVGPIELKFENRTFSVCFAR
jgi:hypothetical protein